MFRLSTAALLAFAAAAGCAKPPPPPGPAPVAIVPLGLECPSALTFPPTVAGRTERSPLSCVVTGNAAGEISLAGVTVESPFGLHDSGTAHAGAGGRVALTLLYTPAAPGQHQGTVALRFDRAGESLSVEVAVSGSASGWHPLPEARPCAVDAPAPLLDQVLGIAGLTQSNFGFSQADLSQSDYFAGGWLDDPFLLSWFRGARDVPARIGCFEGDAAAALDVIAQGPTPVASMIRHAARLIDRGVYATPVPQWPDVSTFEEALDAICTGPAAPCTALTGEVPADLAAALTPILRAIEAGLEARQGLDPSGRTHDYWWQHGGNLSLIQATAERPDPNRFDDRAYLLGHGRDALNGAAAQIAWAIEQVDWSKFRGRTGVAFELVTAAGVVLVTDAAAHTHAAGGPPVLLHLDLGGADTYLGPVGANASGANAVSVAIDLEGNDRYGYTAITTPHDRPGLPPADADGRYAGNAQYGPVSFSTTSRQGAGRNGIGFLFDLGGGNDRYESLRASQGYAHLGVGVLFDDGGDDVYVAEQAAQGAGQFGIGLLIDLGAGKDTRASFTDSQGFAYVGGAGFLYDGGGDDSYRCDHGDPAQGGIRLYYSPQMPTDGNSSFCQGAGFGMRGQTRETHLSGGLGILRDAAGDDSYEASVFAQGTGYWQGTGILSDGSGSDAYDAYYYVQGGAAHYAVGVLADDGPGNDRFNTVRPARYVTLGTGHDFSLGALLNEAGADEYRIPALSAGASNCNGIGVFVDVAGADTYAASSDYGSGMGNVSTECIDTRPNARSIGIMIDAGGVDSYLYPLSTLPVPHDGETWGHARNGLPSEHGGGIDGEGEPGIHPGGA